MLVVSLAEEVVVVVVVGGSCRDGADVLRVREGCGGVLRSCAAGCVWRETVQRGARALRMGSLQRRARCRRAWREGMARFMSLTVSVEGLSRSE